MKRISRVATDNELGVRFLYPVPRRNMGKTIKTINVYPRGQKVELTKGLVGTIIGAYIQNENYVNYNVSYWCKDERKIITLEECEVIPLPTDKKDIVKIGFDV